MKQKRSTKQKRNMKPINITDLNVDVLKLIMVFVAKSSDGARSFARATSVCKGFLELAEDTEVLKTVVFDKGRVSRFGESFWKIDGLLFKCLRARNSAANDILKTISKLTLDAVARKDLSLLGLSEHVALDRAQWRKMIHVADPNSLGHEYTGEHLHYSKVKLRAVMAAWMDLIQSMEAVITVSTRARWRAATLANKKFKQKLHDFRMRMDEISEHMELLAAKQQIKQLFNDFRMGTIEMSDRVEQFTVDALRLEGK